MDMSPILVKGCKIQAYARHSGSLSRKGSLSFHICCDIARASVFLVSSKGPPHFIAFNDLQGDADDP
jgi:hypothetical protein